MDSEDSEDENVPCTSAQTLERDRRRQEKELLVPKTPAKAKKLTPKEKKRLSRARKS